MSPTKYDLILIDLDETLFDFRTSQLRAFNHTLQAFGLQANAEHLRIFDQIQHELWSQFERGEVTKEFVFANRFHRLMNQVGHSADGLQVNDLFLEQLGGGSDLMDGAEELCRYLHARYPLVIVTNGNSKTQRQRLAQSPLAPYLPLMVVSDDIGVGKPHPEIFWRAVELAGMPRDARILMIGDNPRADILGAKACGFDTCWYRPGSDLPPTDIEATYEVKTLAAIQSFL